MQSDSLHSVVLQSTLLTPPQLKLSISEIFFVVSFDHRCWEDPPDRRAVEPLRDDPLKLTNDNTKWQEHT
jgi:hypothetical protein